MQIAGLSLTWSLFFTSYTAIGLIPALMLYYDIKNMQLASDNTDLDSISNLYIDSVSPLKRVCSLIWHRCYKSNDK